VDDFTPTRLLHIELGNNHLSACLVDNLPERNIKWAALSYVWGEDQVAKTTSSSLSAMKTSISVETLPQTLKDALVVCRKLSLEYLWVDCLCIVQDDRDDLTRELANMPKIYQQAWVTISASTAHSTSEGFLHDRAIASKDTGTTSLPYLANDGVHIGEVIVGDTYSDATTLNSTLPIHRRAW
jgi:hypothetical protein